MTDTGGGGGGEEPAEPPPQDVAINTMHDKAIALEAILWSMTILSRNF
ncbi:hypothetical protein ACFOWX_03155 [Sphingorhabdus arenilitoris]|uniref:Uncharacterized protein n=1 Tax=Sphingorhabdus arenilitoris TaxID=1490041 RepID=A0ABV8RDC2_9SPHN